MTYRIEWRVPGGVDTEPQTFCATGEPGRWYIISEYAMESCGQPEESTPELMARADEEWGRKDSNRAIGLPSTTRAGNTPLDLNTDAPVRSSA